MAGKLIGELVALETRDRISLDGFYIENTRSRKGVIYVHGLCGSIHAGKRLESLANAVLSAGYSLLVFNNRGFGMINSFRKTTKKNGWLVAGGSAESFKDSRIDISAAVNFLKKRGCRKIVLIGSSTGCQKSIYYLANRPDRSVKGLILLAPVNDTEGEIVSRGNAEFKRAFAKAKELTRKGKSMTFVTNLCAKRFYDLHRPRSLEGGVLDFSSEKMRFISKIRVPILALLGDADQYVAKGMHQQRLDLIKKSTNPEFGCETILIRNGDHSFRTNLAAMSRVIKNWLVKQ